MKKLLTLLLLSPLAFAEIKETALDCKWERSVYNLFPTQQLERYSDESIVVTDLGDFVDWVWIDMYGFRYKADKRSNHFTWTAPDANYDSWDYRHTLDTVTGKLEVILHTGLAEDVDLEYEMKREPDGTIKNNTQYYKCSKVTPLFD